MFQRIFHLSKEGSRAIRKASVWLALFHLATFLPVIPLAAVSEQMMRYLFEGGQHKIALLPYMAALLVIVFLMFVAYKFAYHKEYLTSGEEEYQLRMELADKLRRLPLSFFGRRELSDLTSVIMDDVQTVSHVLSQSAAELLSGFLSGFAALFLLAVYDIRLAGCLAACLPVAVHVSAGRVNALLAEEEQTGAEVKPERFNIEFDHVDFAYNEEKVLKNVSFVAKQGEITALVGPSGSGKSTLTRLAARFWDAGAGRVLVGGKDIRGIAPEKLLENYSIVFQDVVLFNDTIYNNIRIGKADATKEEVYRAARLAACDEFIERLPEGYDTVIGENGKTLSGGERQRLSIARAFLKDAPVILLDESTASIDPENETKIQQAIGRLIENKTVLIIAHKLRSIADCDKIVVLNEGKVVEEGTHRQLLDRKGLYHKLYYLQRESLAWKIKA